MTDKPEQNDLPDEGRPADPDDAGPADEDAEVTQPVRPTAPTTAWEQPPTEPPAEDVPAAPEEPATASWEPFSRTDAGPDSPYGAPVPESPPADPPPAPAYEPPPYEPAAYQPPPAYGAPPPSTSDAPDAPPPPPPAVGDAPASPYAAPAPADQPASPYAAPGPADQPPSPYAAPGPADQPAYGAAPPPYGSPAPAGPPGQPGQVPYGTPSYGGPGAVPDAEANALRTQGITSLVVNLVALLFCCGLFSIGGAICAGMALGRVQSDKPSARNLLKWSWWLLAANVIVLVIWVFILIGIVASDSRL